ncbi:MAG: serine hydrolase, partial [Phycisphaerales bacterium]|nr:serine hydrolase [Phycisphaerales bacterium]
LEYGAFGLYLTPRDLARFGQMVLDDGVWQGRRIVSEAWLEQATAMHVERPDGWHYGYYFWIDAARGYIAARGHGGQHALVVPELDLVIVITAESTGSGDMGLSVSDIDALIAGVIAAVRE